MPSAQGHITVRRRARDGENAVRIDLDNEHEDFIYDDSNNRLSGHVTSQARLYDGSAAVTNGVVWSIEYDGTFGTGLFNGGAATDDDDGHFTDEYGYSYNLYEMCVCWITSEGLLHVNGISVRSVSAAVKVKAMYKGNAYYAVFSANKRKQDKYELCITPNAIPFNTSRAWANTPMDVRVNRMSLDGVRHDGIALVESYNLELTVVAKYKTSASQSAAWHDLDYVDGIISRLTLTSAIVQHNESIMFELRKSVFGEYDPDDATSYSVEDYETIPIVKVDDGDDGVNRWLEPSVTEVRRYQTGNFSTPTISCSKKKQVGAGSPVEATDCTMHYTYTDGGTEHTVNNYAGGSINIGLWWSKIVFNLYLDGTLIASQTVLIIDTPTSVAANLLNGTNFTDEPDGVTTFASNKQLLRDALDGQVALRCLGTFGNATHIDFFKQKILKTNDIRVQAATWYTLSFWAKSEPYIQENVNETSDAYGFGLRSFYAEAGVEYKLRFNGYVDSQAVQEGRELRVFIYNDDWSWQTHKETSSTTPTTLAVTFTVPTTGTYRIQAYVYAASATGTGKATLNWYRLYRSEKLTSHVYPSLIDTDAVQVIDGVIQGSKPSDGRNQLELTTSWEKHTFTFKTKQILPTEDNSVLFRLPIACNGAQICMPKLERGVFATDWCRSERDKQGLSYRLVCKDSIQEGSTGCDIKVMMSYGEESKVLTYAEETAKGLAVTGTNVQWDSSHQRLYISGGASASSTYTITLTLNGTTCDQKQVTVTPNGAQGLAGCILRVSEWTTGVQFHNDESLTSGTRYLDIAVVTTGLNTFNAYKCKVTHTSSNAIPVTNTTYWQAFNELLPIYTPLIMAQNALLRFAQTNQLLVMKSDGTTVAAGLGGGNFPLWIGNTEPNGASFKVSIDGILSAVGAKLNDAEISGVLRANLGFGSSLDMANLEYENGYHSIVPEDDLCSLYYAKAVRAGNDARFLRLPNPANYEGLTLQFFIATTSGGWDYSYYFLWSDANWLCVKEFNYYSIQQNVVVENTARPYKMYTSAGTNHLFTNTLYEFRVIGGKWYHIRGLWTGE